MEIRLTIVITNRADRASVIADVRYNSVWGNSRKYTTGYLSNTYSEHRNT
jgi:hypothetical protein